jgi:hypothetical protein
MKFGAASDEVGEHILTETRDFGCVLTEPFEERRVTDERNFDGLGHAGAQLAGRQRAQQRDVIDDGVWRGETPEEVLLSESVHAILDADTGIVLAEYRAWQPNQPNPAVYGGRRKTRDVQHGAAADHDAKRVPVEALFRQLTLDPRQHGGVVFRLFAPFNGQYRSREFDA